MFCFWRFLYYVVSGKQRIINTIINQFSRFFADHFEPSVSTSPILNNSDILDTFAIKKISKQRIDDDICNLDKRNCQGTTGIPSIFMKSFLNLSKPLCMFYSKCVQFISQRPQWGRGDEFDPILYERLNPNKWRYKTWWIIFEGLYPERLLKLVTLKKHKVLRTRLLLVVSAWIATFDSNILLDVSSYPYVECMNHICSDMVSVRYHKLLYDPENISLVNLLDLVLFEYSIDFQIKLFIGSNLQDEL